MTIADVELGWNLAHEDLDHLLTQNPPVPILPSSTWSTVQGDVDHGTATLGVLASGNNGYGTTGLVPGATLRVMPVNDFTDPTWNGANSVVMATLNLRPGDVLLVEAQVPVPGTSINLPFEINPAEYAAVAQAAALGIHVIEPAGNTTGGLSLDTSPLVRTGGGTGPSLFDRYVRDSGAVLVGAGASAVTQGIHAVYPNSNVGSKVDTYSWGQNVTTLGYGPNPPGLSTLCGAFFNPFPAAPNQDQYYTHCFNGTSSAGAIVAGAAAILEQKHRADFGRPFGTRELRALLSLGTGSAGVGHQPDLAYQIDLMDNGGLVDHLFEHPPVPNQSRPYFGKAVAGGGDVDGDGRDDLIVGIPGFDVPIPSGGNLWDAGRVYVFSGATGRVLYQVDGTQVDEDLGTAVTIAGDFNLDGFADFAIGSPGDATNGLDAGKVTIYSGVDGQVMVNPFLGTAGERYGAAVDWVGNINPPGSASSQPEPFDDLLIGAPGANFGAGRSEVVNLLGQVLHSAAGTASDELGFAVAGAGDLDSDGIPDLLVGAPGFWDGVSNNPTGAAYAYSGNTGAQILKVVGHPTAALISPQRFGAAVDGAGDFDGDGSNDVVVGAPKGTFIPGGEFGRADVFDKNGFLIASFDGGHPRDNLGKGVAGLGDFDGDGVDDIALGSPNQGGFLAGRPGRVRVVLGAVPGNDPPSFKERVFYTLDDATEWGAAVGAAGDVNGDGLADVVSGEPNTGDGGRAHVFTVGPGPDPFAGQARLVAFVPAIEAHDVDGDGFAGGGRSPGTTQFTLDAGPAWAGADYVVLGIPDVGPFLTGGAGVLDGQGVTSTPVFGPFQAGLLCGGVGFRFGFLGAALRDLDGNGQYDIFVLSNMTEVEIINEFAPTCQ